MSKKQSSRCMMRLWVSGIGFVLLCSSARMALCEDRDTRVSGSNTLRLQEYFNRGDRASSPYQSSDTHWYDELDLSLVQRASPYDTRRAEFFGVMNQSDYRSDEKGVRPERWRLLQEKGDFAIPYRVEVGDYYSDVSYRTQSRSLKGMQLELQPGGSLFDEQHSVLLFAGADEPAWDKFHSSRNNSAGASWLMEATPVGSLSLNCIFNSRETDAAQDLPHRNQHVASVAWEKLLELGDHRLTFESELGRFSGDHDDADGEDNAQNKEENGLYGQATWQTPWAVDYRFRFERYGHDYRPYGANVSADRQSYENHVTWQHSSGIQLRLRQQQFEDAFETTNELDSNVYGVGLSGPFLKPWVPDLSGNLDTFMRYNLNQAETVDDRTFSSNLNLSKPIAENWALRPGVFIQHNRDSLPGGAPDAWTYQFALSADHSFQWGKLTGSISPGFNVRLMRGGDSKSNDVGPLLATQLAYGPHTFGVDASYLGQRRHKRDAVDSDQYNVAANYGYTMGNNTFGIEFESRGLAPSPGRSSEAYRVAIFWTMGFDFDVPLRRRGAADVPSLPVAAKPADRPGPHTLAQLPPGAPLDALTEYLAGIGIRGPIDLPDVRVFEARLLPRITRRQRVALGYDASRKVTRSGLIIEFRNLGDPDTVSQTFAKVRTELFRAFGRPAIFFEEGDFTPALPLDVSTSRFIRLYEWHTPSGILRFGIPRRLDRQVRMEVQHAREFPPQRRALWSMKKVR